MTNITINFSNITCGFGKRKLFKDLSCILANTSDTGRIIALMGPSGVGKTTFCELALGIRRPQKGAIVFTPHDTNVAVIPQKAVLFDELSVIDNIACLQFSKTLGKTFDMNRVQHAVESLNLVEVMQSETSAGAISGGEAQRVMLARIQTISCNVLILDEPCSFLDNRVKDSFLAALRATVDESRLLALMVTHVWDEAQLVADEVLFFSQTPGKPVTLHKQSISEARRHPPTIDALYGIHWPNCLVLDATEIASDSGLSEKKIPRGARYVCLHPDFGPQASNDEWASELWNKTTKSSRFQTGHLSNRTDTTNFSTPLTTNFYNQDGELIKN